MGIILIIFVVAFCQESLNIGTLSLGIIAWTYVHIGQMIRLTLSGIVAKCQYC